MWNYRNHLIHGKADRHGNAKAMKKTVFLIFVASLFSLLAACSGGVPRNILGTPLPSPTETLISEFSLTSQAGQVQAQITKSAAEAQLAGLNVQGTQAALQLTLAVATEQYFDRQTQTAGTATAVANASATAAQNANLTLTAVASQQAINASDTQVAKTQTAIPQQATATAIYYASQADERRDQSEKAAQWFTTWALRLALAFVFVVGIVFVIFGGKAVYEARYAILAYFGVVRWGKDGKPYIIAPVKGGLHIWDPSRALDPGMTIIAADHQLTTSGGAVDKEHQLQLAQHAQTVEYTLAQNTHAGQPQNQQALPRSSQVSAQPPLLGTQNVPAQLPGNSDIKILVVEPSRVQDWVDEATGQIIDGEVTDI